jgi:hypothetical protein
MDFKTMADDRVPSPAKDAGSGKEIEKELLWFPVYPDRFLASVRWKKMTDFQRGWYWQLLLLMTRSKPLGYLAADDGQLGTLAGAHSKQYWDSHAGLVLACFKVREFDGRRWIYNETLLEVLTEQQRKHAKAVSRGRLGGKTKNNSSSTSISYSSEFEEVWKTKTWKCVSKRTAGKAFEAALERLQQKPARGARANIRSSRESAALYLGEAMQAFKESDAGKNNGLFDTYQPPYPASWLNSERYDDDRRTWRRNTGTPGTIDPPGEAPRVLTPEEHARRRAQENCPICSGTGWNIRAGKGYRCECRRSAATVPGSLPSRERS